MSGPVSEIFTVEKSFHFEAAHALPKHAGKCARIHGHSFRMTIICRGEERKSSGPETGMLLDHAKITAVVKPIWEAHLDHYFLNESCGLLNPTVEALCVWLWDRFAPGLPELYRIHFRETCTAAYSYRRAK